MTDLSFLLEYINPIILGICLAVGYALKTAFDKFPNKYIPLAALCAGTVIAILINLSSGINAQVILGAMISGLAVCWFVLAPAKIQSANNAANQQVIEYSDQLEAKTASIEALNEELNIAKLARTSAEKQAQTANEKAGAYDALFEAQKLAGEAKYEEAAEALSKVNADNLAEGAKSIYDDVSAKVNATVIEDLYKKGEDSFNAGNYEEAKTNLAKVVELNASHDYAQYYLARSYEQLGDVTNAKVHYQKVVELLPATTQRAQTAQNYLNAHP